MAALRSAGLAPALAVATVAGLGHHAGVRGVITNPAYDVWSRLQAAETVLYAALMGTPLDKAWIEDVVRGQHEEERYRIQQAAEATEQEQSRANLRAILLDPQKRRAFILGELLPAAQANPLSGSMWQDAFNLYAEAWTKSGLPEDERPYADGRALSKAMQEADRRARK